jgi:hypothetical protein
MTTPVPASTPWVPMWSLQGGVAIGYVGGWVPGTYQAGQIVVDNGIEYMCVRQTNKRPTPWAASQAASYGTSLPASPIDGQEAVLVDSLTAPSYQWRFRYNANNTTLYKWEFVGGSSIFAVGGNFTTPTGPTGFIDGNGPSVPLPRPGAYEYSWGVSYCYLVSASPAGSAMMAVSLGGAVQNQFYYNNTIPAPGAMSYVGTAASGGVAKCQFQCNVANTATFVYPWISIKPIRVS